MSISNQMKEQNKFNHLLFVHFLCLHQKVFESVVMVILSATLPHERNLRCCHGK